MDFRSLKSILKKSSWVLFLGIFFNLALSLPLGVWAQEEANPVPGKAPSSQAEPAKDPSTQSDPPATILAEPQLEPEVGAPEADSAGQPVSKQGPVSAYGEFQPGEGDLYFLIRREWVNRQRVLKESGPEVADKILPRIASLRLDLGIENMIPYSEVLMQESSRSLKEGDKKRAENLARFAQYLSPDYPASDFHFAKIYFRVHPLDIKVSISAIINGIQKHFTILPNLLRHIFLRPVFLFPRP